MTDDTTEYTPEERRLADRLAWMNNLSDRLVGPAWTMEQAARWLIEHGVGFTDAQHDARVRADALNEAAREIYNGAPGKEQELYDHGAALWLEQRAGYILYAADPETIAQQSSNRRARAALLTNPTGDKGEVSR